MKKNKGEILEIHVAVRRKIGYGRINGTFLLDQVALHARCKGHGACPCGRAPRGFVIEVDYQICQQGRAYQAIWARIP